MPKTFLNFMILTEMTAEEILELAKTYGIGVNKYKICICWKDELLKFAEAIYEEGRESASCDGVY